VRRRALDASTLSRRRYAGFRASRIACHTLSLVAAQVVDESALAAQEARVLEASDRLADVEFTHSMTRRSIRADTGRPDDLAPALDLLGQKLREVFGTAALRRNDLEAEVLQALAH